MPKGWSTFVAVFCLLICPLAAAAALAASALLRGRCASGHHPAAAAPATAGLRRPVPASSTGRDAGQITTAMTEFAPAICPRREGSHRQVSLDERTQAIAAFLAGPKE